MDEQRPKQQVRARGSRAVTKTTVEPSKALWRLLIDQTSDLAVDEILSDPALHAEAKAYLPIALAKVEPCGRKYVITSIMQLFSVFVQQDRTEEEWVSFWKLYGSALEDIPRSALDAAINEAVCMPDAEFLPKPGPLRALALKHAEKDYQAAYSARRAANSIPRRPAAPMTEEEREAKRVMIADVVGRLGRRPKVSKKATASEE